MDRPPGRNMRNMTWTEYGKLETKLVSSLKGYMERHHINKLDAIIGIWRGGIILARSMASKLGEIPLVVINYGPDTEKPPSIMSEHPIEELKTRKNRETRKFVTVLVDDISDSGKTFARVKTWMERKYPWSIITASLVLKKYSTFHTDVHAQLDESGDWIQFPWE
ncbi:MAG: phosphoribosyltransferase family protein [Promethearchaeota archaeon]